MLYIEHQSSFISGRYLQTQSLNVLPRRMKDLMMMTWAWSYRSNCPLHCQYLPNPILPCFVVAVVSVLGYQQDRLQLRQPRLRTRSLASSSEHLSPSLMGTSSVPRVEDYENREAVDRRRRRRRQTNLRRHRPKEHPDSHRSGLCRQRRRNIQSSLEPRRRRSQKEQPPRCFRQTHLSRDRSICRYSCARTFARRFL